jgi:hypothetical protein
MDKMSDSAYRLSSKNSGMLIAIQSKWQVGKKLAQGDNTLSFVCCVTTPSEELKRAQHPIRN